MVTEVNQIEIHEPQDHTLNKEQKKIIHTAFVHLMQ